ncbi:MAG: iron-containing alcohol dehydrogenase [Myxococcales bacterium]|nr:iron-containing alcohol dehydrogenase [Myxococcales bacterium]
MLETIASILSLVIQLVRQLGVTGTAKDVLDVTNKLIQQTGLVEVRLRSLRTQIEAMVADGREPTDAEWLQIKSRLQSTHDQIQSVVIDG